MNYCARIHHLTKALPLAMAMLGMLCIWAPTTHAATIETNGTLMIVTFTNADTKNGQLDRLSVGVEGSSLTFPDSGSYSYEPLDGIDTVRFVNRSKSRVYYQSQYFVGPGGKQYRVEIVDETNRPSSWPAIRLEYPNNYAYRKIVGSGKSLDIDGNGTWDVYVAKGRVGELLVRTGKGRDLVNYRRLRLRPPSGSGGLVTYLGGGRDVFHGSPYQDRVFGGWSASKASTTPAEGTQASVCKAQWTTSRNSTPVMLHKSESNPSTRMGEPHSAAKKALLDSRGQCNSKLVRATDWTMNDKGSLFSLPDIQWNLDDFGAISAVDWLLPFRFRVSFAIDWLFLYDAINSVIQAMQAIKQKLHQFSGCLSDIHNRCWG